MTQGRYYGKYEYLLDDKNRIRLPSQFKDYLGEKIKLGEGNGKYLVVYSESDFDKVVMDTLSDLRKDPSRDKEILYRDLISGIMDSKRDPQGRYLIPSELIEYAELQGPILVVGFIDHIEIWSKANYQNRYSASVTFSREDKIEMLQMEARVAKEVEMEYRAERMRKLTLQKLKEELGEDND